MSDRDDLRIEWFTRGAVVRPDESFFTIHRTANVYLSRTAWEALGRPVKARAGFDPGRRIVAVRATDAEDAEGVSVRATSGGQSKVMYLKTFLDHYEIDYTVARRFSARDFGDGVIGFELDGPSQVTGPGRRKASK